MFLKCKVTRYINIKIRVYQFLPCDKNRFKPLYRLPLVHILCLHRLVLHILCPYYFGRFVVAGMAPPWGHKNIEKFVLYSRGIYNIFEQGYKLTKIDIHKVARIHLAGYTVFYFYIVPFILESAKNLVPNIEKVTEIRVHIERVLGVVYPVMGRGQN